MPLVIEVKVIPASGRVLWKLEAGDRLKCYLTSPPERGKANKELLTLLARALNIPFTSCSILSGATSRLKRVRIDTDSSFDALLDALGIARQMPLF